MAGNVYEAMFLFDPNRYARDAAGIRRQVEEMVQEVGGEVLVSRQWEERRLAYSVKGHRKGIYWLIYCRVDGSHLKTLERQCRNHDAILRHLFLTIDPRIADTLVSHAQAEGESSAAGKADAAAEDAPVEASKSEATTGVEET